MIVGSHDTSERVLVVAEIGNNHEGDPALAAELVRLAAASGADAVKFQTFRTEHYVSAQDRERFERLRRFELGRDRFEELARLARSLGLLFISTPFDLESARFLSGIVDAMKIASGDNTFYPLLEVAARSGRPLIISTGLADVDLVRHIVAYVRTEQCAAQIDPGLAVLHCVSSYPVPPEEADLASIRTLTEEFADVTVGYSDHTLGIEAAILSVALGARIIEKHFTIDRQHSSFRDHQLSADPAEMAELARRVRLAERLMGKGGKRGQPSESAGLLALRRSIVAARDLPAGHTLVTEDITWVRPGGGLAPGGEHRIVGRRLARDVRSGERLLPPDVE